MVKYLVTSSAYELQAACGGLQISWLIAKTMRCCCFGLYCFGITPKSQAVENCLPFFKDQTASAIPVHPRLRPVTLLLC